MCAADFRARARYALTNKWRPMTGIMLLLQAVLGYLGLDVVYETFASELRFFPIGQYAGMQYGYNLHMPSGFMGYALIALMLATVLLGSLATVGAYRVSANVIKGEWPRTADLFPMGLLGKAIAMNIVRSLLVGVQMLLIVPGIMAYFRYSMADYLLAVKPELGPIEALRESRRCMRGRKWPLFCLQFSYMGWALAAAIAPSLCLTFLPAGWISMILSTLLTWLCGGAFYAYMFVGETVFYDDALNGSLKREWQEAAARAYTDAEREAGADAAPQAAPEPKAPAVDESEIHAMFLRHGCSRERMRNLGLLDEYEAMNPSSIGEERWKRDYAQQLMRRFDKDASALEDLILLCEEYAMDSLADRALQRIDRHIRERSLPAAQVLDMAAQMLRLLDSGAFAENPGFAQRKKQQIWDMADRLEAILKEEDPDGDWYAPMMRLRMGCRAQ